MGKELRKSSTRGLNNFLMKKRVVVVPQRNDKNNFSEAERVKQGQQGRNEIQIIPHRPLPSNHKLSQTYMDRQIYRHT